MMLVLSQKNTHIAKGGGTRGAEGREGILQELYMELLIDSPFPPRMSKTTPKLARRIASDD